MFVVRCRYSRTLCCWAVLWLIASWTGAQELLQAISHDERSYLEDNYGNDESSTWESWQRYLAQQIASGHGALPHGRIVCAPGEFDPVDRVCFAWRGHTALLKKLIHEVADNTRVCLAVAEDAEAVGEELKAAGCNMANIEIVHAAINTVWIRDYAPWTVYTRDGDCALVDFVYNRPRPLDDRFADVMAGHCRLPLYRCRLVLPGGNLLLDGCGGALLSDMVFDARQGSDPHLCENDVARYLQDYLNCHTVHLLEKMQHDGTGHLDMFCKLVSRRHVLVGEYSSPGAGAGDNYDILNRNARRLAKLKNGRGESFLVTRIPMPAYDGSTYSYTNSLLINDKVLLPVYGKPEDATAVRIYRELLPGHRVVAIDCRDIIASNGAIHCVTQLVMADPLSIRHQQMTKISQQQEFAAEIISFSPPKARGVTLHWRLHQSRPFAVAVMHTQDKRRYVVKIDMPERTHMLEYFIRVENDAGMCETAPKNAVTSSIYYSVRLQK